MRLGASSLSLLSVLLLACGDEAAAGHPADPEPPPLIPPSQLTDTNEVVSAASPPPAISGGTLLVTPDGTLAVMSDPDRDRVSIVDLASHTVRAQLALDPGDEPGRLVADGSGRVHVALRRGGAIATIDLAALRVLARTPVCAAPRGLAFDAASDELVVACASGELVRMATSGENVRTVLQLGSDLRDVAIVDGALLVTRFRSAELLRVDEASGQQTTTRPEPARALFGEPSTGALRADTLSPQLAYRLRADDDGSRLLLSQVERDGEIELQHDEPEVQLPVVPSSPYGGVGTCAGVVQTVLSVVDSDGTIGASTRIPGVLVVDVAHSRGGAVAVAQAGVVSPQLQWLLGSSVGFPPAQTSGLLVFPSGLAAAMSNDRGGAEEPAASCATPSVVLDVPGQVTAVAYTPTGELLAQSREPALLAFVSAAGRFELQTIALGGDSVADTGHELFHSNAGGGVACASCHAEGGDDGHTWRFAGTGPRRTQSLHVGLAGSAPFHWAGDERDFGALLEDVMVGRMGGVHQSPERTAALEQWLYELQPPPAMRAADDAAAQRGKLLFEGEAECSTCHSGSAFSNNQTRDIGKDEALQVPSLVGVGYRKPLMHDGCAADLRARFDPGCGGERHGKTSQLNGDQLDDLIAYLETL